MIVFVDWGTTNMRAWHVDDTGEVIARHCSHMGLRSAISSGFPNVFERVMRDLNADSDCPAVLAGMIGSKQGWQETSYAIAPINARLIAENAVELSDRADTWILGGFVVCPNPTGLKSSVARRSRCWAYSR